MKTDPPDVKAQRLPRSALEIHLHDANEAARALVAAAPDDYRAAVGMAVATGAAAAALHAVPPGAHHDETVRAWLHNFLGLIQVQAKGAGVMMVVSLR